MKTFFLFTRVVVLLFALTSFKTTANYNMAFPAQETQVVNGVYDGHEDYGYNFIITEEDEEYTLTFQEVDEAVLKVFDLNQSSLIGSNFKITYTTQITVTIDDDGYENENEINTIKKLEKL